MLRATWPHQKCSRGRPEKATHQRGNLIRSGVQGDMTRSENVYFGAWHILAIGFRLRKLEREVILPPDHKQARLVFAQLGLPSEIGLDVGAVVVEEVTLNVYLAGLVQKGKLIGPEIRVIALHVGIVADMACPRRSQ